MVRTRWGCLSNSRECRDSHWARSEIKEGFSHPTEGLELRKRSRHGQIQTRPEVGHASQRHCYCARSRRLRSVGGMNSTWSARRSSRLFDSAHLNPTLCSAGRKSTQSGAKLGWAVKSRVVKPQRALCSRSPPSSTEDSSRGRLS